MIKRRKKINRHEMVAQVLLSGESVSPSQFNAIFANSDMEDVIYRISTYIYTIKKDGGIFNITKNGRNIIGYQLLNPEEFDDTGRYVGKVNIEHTDEEKHE